MSLTSPEFNAGRGSPPIWVAEKNYLPKRAGSFAGVGALNQDRQVSEMVISRHRRAQGLVEFGLLLALVAVVAVAGLLLFGGTVSQLMSTTAHSVALNV